MKINQNLTTINRTKVGNPGRVKYIVVHYTGNNGDTAKGNTDYFKSVNRGASAHYFVDEKSIYQCVADGDVAWHCGTTGQYHHAYCRNANSIGIELCSRKDAKGNYYFKPETIANAIDLIRVLMAAYRIPAENAIRHYDVTHKICPAPYVGSTGDMAWADFKKRLTEPTKPAEKPKEEEKEVTQAEFDAKMGAWLLAQAGKTVSAYAKGSWDKAVKAGIFDGSAPRGFLTREQCAVVMDRAGVFGGGK